MGKHTKGKWFTSKAGRQCRYLYKDGTKYGVEIMKKGIFYDEWIGGGHIKEKSLKIQRKAQWRKAKADYYRKRTYNKKKKRFGQSNYRRAMNLYDAGLKKQYKGYY